MAFSPTVLSEVDIESLSSSFSFERVSNDSDDEIICLSRESLAPRTRSPVNDNDSDDDFEFISDRGRSLSVSSSLFDVQTALSRASIHDRPATPVPNDGPTKPSPSTPPSKKKALPYPSPAPTPKPVGHAPAPAPAPAPTAQPPPVASKAAKPKPKKKKKPKVVVAGSTTTVTPPPSPKKKKAKKPKIAAPDSSSSETEKDLGNLRRDGYDAAVSFMDAFLQSPPEITSKAQKLQLYQALIIELGVLPTGPLPGTVTSARNLLGTKAFINIKRYLSTRAKGVEELQKVMHPTRRALMNSLRNKKNRVPKEEVKAMGLNILLVSCF